MFGSPGYLEKSDPEVYGLIAREENRQQNVLEMIASENHTSPAVLAAAGSCLTNKYAEGLPGKRYYGGCEQVDQIETLAIQRCKDLFGCDHVNVQPHSGAQANMAVYFASLQAGDTALAMDLAHGGHLSHGFKINFSGKLYNFVSYGVKEDTQTIDYDQVNALAKAHKPKLIVCGASAYPRKIDFDKLAEIAHSNGAKILADIAHVAGLVCTGLHPDPIPVCDYVTSTTHKTLRGPRGGITMCKDENTRAINSAVFPGMQGGPLCHIVAAKAVAFGEALKPEFKTYMEQVLKNCNALAEELVSKGFSLCSGGSDNHLILLDLRPYDANLTGAQAEDLLGLGGIVVNKNLLPFDTRKAMDASGVRIGTPALTTRGLKEDHMRQIANWIDKLLSSQGDQKVISQVRSETQELCQQFPLPA
ncbi:MAG: serine hydroxymethyltransferase [Phycisphaerae bacterium]|nr:serine hydroxymethyltransferase [Phycisphaerae bacterium]